MKVTRKYGNTFYTFDYDGDDEMGFWEGLKFVGKCILFISILCGLGWFFDTCF